MKTLLSIWFLIVFLFHVGGYYLVFWGLTYQAKQELIQRLDRCSYSETETIEIKIPMVLPYQLNQQEYERVDGEFTYQGQLYRLAKQKHENDTLYLVCIDSKQEMLLTNSLNDFIKLSNDIPTTSKHAIYFICKLLKDYQRETHEDLIAGAGWFLTIFYSEEKSLYFNPHIPVSSPPPKLLG